MRIDVITLFPDWVSSVAEVGIVRRAAEQGYLSLYCTNPRDFATDVHRTVDDRPYGGGPGMVMKADVLLDSIRFVRQANQGKLIYLSPQGKPLQQSDLNHFAAADELVLLCGRYEGVDERVLRLAVDAEYSLGDYVLSGGELGAMVMIDGITRLLPGALGHAESAVQDSFTDGLLDCPHYTRPEVVADCGIPPVLASGDHAAIANWRKKQALGNTWRKRPDLLQHRILSSAEQAMLDEYKLEYRISSEVD